jgi:4-methylaminobutanoate oxidase (formaldehyde-forming)
MLLHEEPIYRDGDLVGRVASAGYGHTLGRSVALGYVEAPEPGLPRSWFETGHYEVELGCERHSARASLQPMYDPKSERPKS